MAAIPVKVITHPQPGLFGAAAAFAEEHQPMKDVESIMQLAPVIPVLVIDDVAHARPIAEALVAGGLRALEVTLRTPVALDAIREMAKVEGAMVGAGTVLNEARSGRQRSSRRAVHCLARPDRTAEQGKLSRREFLSCPASLRPATSCADWIWA